MVTITGYQQRKTAEGKTFLVLEVEGGLQVQTSIATGKLYASISKATLPCAFDEQTAKALIGTTLPGSIAKELCDPYEITDQKTGEPLTLNSRNVYKEPEMAPDGVRPVLKKRVEEIEVL